MDPFDHAERWTEDEVRERVASWMRFATPVQESFLPSFDGHPDRPLVVRIIEEMTRPKKQIREIRFTPPCDRFDRWQKAADAIGVPLTIWVQLAADGVLPRSEEPRETATAPVQETTQEGPMLRERIIAAVGPNGMVRRGDVRELAGRLGVSRRAVLQSLGSMVGSRRARREGDAYHMVEKE